MKRRSRKRNQLIFPNGRVILCLLIPRHLGKYESMMETTVDWLEYLAEDFLEEIFKKIVLNFFLKTVLEVPEEIYSNISSKIVPKLHLGMNLNIPLKFLKLFLECFQRFLRIFFFPCECFQKSVSVIIQRNPRIFFSQIFFQAFQFLEENLVGDFRDFPRWFSSEISQRILFFLKFVRKFSIKSLFFLRYSRNVPPAILANVHTGFL